MAAADTGERRGGADDRAIAAERSVVRFDAPDRREDSGFNAIGARDGGERCGVLHKQFAAARDPLVTDQRVKIVPSRLREFRLSVKFIHDA